MIPYLDNEFSQNWKEILGRNKLIEMILIRRDMIGKKILMDNISEIKISQDLFNYNSTKKKQIKIFENWQIMKRGFLQLPEGKYARFQLD